jgi:hypothetical protein
MSNYQIVTPEGQDYLTANQLANNQTYNTEEVTLDEDMAATTTPVVLLNGFGGAQLQGQITVDTASLSANMVLCTLPTHLVPQTDTYHPVVVLRSGAFVSNAVKVDESSQEVILLTQPQQNDVVVLDAVSFLVDSYK